MKQHPHHISNTPLKGSSPELNRKMFVSGPSQAAWYDDIYKAFLHYSNNNYDYRVHRPIVMKDADNGMTLLTRLTPPTIKKVAHEATVGDQSKLIGVKKEAIDKELDKFLNIKRR